MFEEWGWSHDEASRHASQVEHFGEAEMDRTANLATTYTPAATMSAMTVISAIMEPLRRPYIASCAS